MSKNQLINSQLDNYTCYLMYRRQFITLAENVFIIDGLSTFCDIAYINKILLSRGQIAFFKDELIDKDALIALPFTTIGPLDIYCRPKRIIVAGQNGYNRRLNRGEFVIMYDNNGRYSILPDVLAYAERMALATRVIDINLSNQKLPRVWKTKTGSEKTIKDLVNNVNSNAETVITYDNIDLDDTTAVLTAVPYVADKVQEEKDHIYNEFLRFIGVANIEYKKKERNIKDEIKAMQGGTIASRFSRFESRKQAIDKIKEVFGIELKVRYYDGIPSSVDDLEDATDDSTDIEEVNK